MMLLPKVCICLPCYNNEDTIERTLKSIFEQTYKNYDVVIVDNRSTDNTVDRIHKVISDYKDFVGKVKIIINDKNIGASNNWNKCIENSYGDYMCLYHADDVYLPTIVEKQVSYMIEHLDVGIVFVNAYIIDSEDNIVSEHKVPLKYVNEGILGFEDICECLINDGHIMMPPSGMYRISALRKYNYRFSEKYKYGFDTDFFIEIGKKHRLAFLNEKLMKYRLYNSASASYRVVLRYKHTLHDDFIDVIKNQIIKEGVTYKLDSIEYIRLYNKGIKEKMIKAFINGDYTYAKKMLNKFDSRLPYKRLWIWKLVLNFGLPQIVRKYIAYKRYKNFFRGNFDNIKLGIEE